MGKRKFLQWYCRFLKRKTPGGRPLIPIRSLTSIHDRRPKSEMEFSIRLPVLLVITGLVMAARAPAQDRLSREYSPPGKLFDIGGRKLHLYCTGQGEPAVILMAGGGAFSIDWSLVQPEIAGNTRVCSYDRAGLGWSDPGPADETVEQTIGDLQAVLRAAGEKGPWVLVGASIGGIFIRAWQRAFPEQVAGLVFTNSSNRIGLEVKGKIGLIWDLSEEDVRSGYPRPASVTKGPRPIHEGEPFDRLPADLQAARLWLDVRLWERSDPTRAVPDSLLSWRKEFLKEFDETVSTGGPILGHLPVVVLSSGPPGTESERQKRDSAAPLLDFLSSNTVHMIAGSGHEIHLYQPGMVVQAISRAVAAVRSRVPLSDR
jgi:pimeloyl-ACP methyl ester carboxylesterase